MLYRTRNVYRVRSLFIFHCCILQVDKLEVKYSLPGRDGTEISVIQDEKCIQSENFVHISLHCILQVDKLEVKYSLPGRDGTEISVIQDEKCIQSENLIMFHKNYVESFGEVNKELASFFSSRQKECTLYLM